MMEAGKHASFFQTNPFFRVLFREIDRMSGSIVYLFLTLIGPLFSFIVLLNIFSAEVPRNIPVGIVDLDNTQFSRKIALWVGATPEAEIKSDFPNLAEAYQKMAEGQIDAIVVIPEGTEKSILKGSQQILPVYINDLNILKGGFLQKGIYKALATLSGGIKLEIAKKKGMSDDQAMAYIQPVNLHQHVLFNPSGNYSYFLLTAILPLMLVVFTMFSSVYAIGIEVKEGTGPEWLEHSSGSIIVAFVAKLFPYTILFIVDVMVMNVVLFLQMGTPLRGSFFMIVLGEMTMIVTYQLIAVVLISLTSNLRLSLSLATVYSMMALTFSGLTFPRFAMPTLVHVFSALFPFTYWVEIFISQAIRGEKVVNSFISLSSMLAFILVSVAFFPRLKKILSEKKYWGRI
jgi:ABC-2 type transport system permease protein